MRNDDTKLPEHIRHYAGSNRYVKIGPIPGLDERPDCHLARVEIGDAEWRLTADDLRAIAADIDRRAGRAQVGGMVVDDAMVQAALDAYNHDMLHGPPEQDFCADDECDILAGVRPLPPPPTDGAKVAGGDRG